MTYNSAAPAIRFPNVYGIDMPTTKELIAHGRTDEEVAAAIEADWVVYLDLTSLIESVNQCAEEVKLPKFEHFDCSCFNGEYVTGGVTADYLKEIHLERNDTSMKAKKMVHSFDEDEGDELDNIDMYNSS